MRDEAGGEIYVLGRRHAVVDMQALLRHLEILVGGQVAEVIIRSLETGLGKDDADRIRKENPDKTIQQIIEKLTESDRLCGFGLTQVTLPEDGSGRVMLEVKNPYLKDNGPAKMLHFAWWAGVLSILLNKDFEIADVNFDESSNSMRGHFLPRRK
jgi:hypothetical protein